MNLERVIRLSYQALGIPKETQAIAKGEAQASRRFEVAPPDVKAVRERTGLTQREFAQLMRVSIKTLHP